MWGGFIPPRAKGDKQLDQAPGLDGECRVNSRISVGNRST